MFCIVFKTYPVTGRSEPKGGRANLAEALGAQRPQGRDSRMGEAESEQSPVTKSGDSRVTWLFVQSHYALPYTSGFA